MKPLIALTRSSYNCREDAVKNAFETNMMINLRRTRATQLTHFIIHTLRDFIPYECQGRATDELFKLLHDHGAEIVTDNTRSEAGLPPRGPDGWTLEEMMALEKRRLELLTAPIAIRSGSALIRPDEEPEGDERSPRAAPLA